MMMIAIGQEKTITSQTFPKGNDYVSFALHIIAHPKVPSPYFRAAFKKKEKEKIDANNMRRIVRKVLRAFWQLKRKHSRKCDVFFCCSARTWFILPDYRQTGGTYCTVGLRLTNVLRAKRNSQAFIWHENCITSTVMY